MSEHELIDTGDPYDPQQVEIYEDKKSKNLVKEDDAIEAMLRRRKDAYTRWMKGAADAADMQIVMADLFWFCRVDKPSFDPNDGPHAETLSKMKDGRREVFMRIKDFSVLDFDTIYRKYTGQR